MIVVSYATEKYWPAAQRLEKSMQRVGLRYYVEYMDDFSNKKGHKIYKPFFLERMFVKFPGENITLVDGDSYFIRKPPQLNISADMGLVVGKHHENHQYWFSDAFHIHHPTEGTRHFIRIWKRLCEDRDWITGNNHPRILAAFYLSRRMTSFEYIDLKGSFSRNRGKPGEIIY